MWLILVVGIFGWILMGKIEITQIIKRKAAIYDVDWKLVWSIAWQESRLDHNAVGDDGRSIGVMQILDTTANEIAGRQVSPEELKMPEFNIELGTRYIRYQLDRYGGDSRKAVAAYNAGSYRERSPGVPINLEYVNGVFAVYNSVASITV